MINYSRNALLCICLFLAFDACTAQRSQERVEVGAEVLLKNHLDELKGKRVGLAMNPTARVNGVHMLDTLMSLGVNITALFAAEHGFRGDVTAGEEIKDGVDLQTGLPVFSLYGQTKRPTREMLEKVDVILFDMQDVGARFYTYNVTLGYIIEEATKYGKQVWILDRPNPAGGDYVSGWVLEENFTSFVGAYPIPMAHGMTLGELMKMAIGEQWIQVGDESLVKVIEMKNWTRSMKWNNTGLEWVPPSPNLPTFEHAYVYLGTVLFEGTNVSEGRGTEDPFLTIGAPDTGYENDWTSMVSEIFGIEIDTLHITPRDIPGKSMNPKLEGQIVKAVSINVPDFNQLDPVYLGTTLLSEFQKNTPSFEVNRFLNNLAGVDLVDAISTGRAMPSWDNQIKEFKNRRAPYLIYSN